MKWEKVKKQDAVFLDSGVTVVLDSVDNSYKTATVYCDGRPSLRVSNEPYGGAIEVSMLAKPVMVKRWALTGSCLELSVFESFDTKARAEQRKEELERADHKAELEIREVEVPEGEE
jgi:hypothetical protein